MRHRIPVGPTTREFVPPPPGVRVPGLAPGDTGAVPNCRYTLAYHIYKRAKAPLTCVAPKREGKGLQPPSEPGRRAIPKKEVAINPINLRDELAMLAQSLNKKWA